MKLKTFLAISALCAPSFVVFSPEKAQALPFNENCASMQAYANALNWSNPTRFTGFENVGYLEYGGIIFCNQNGGGFVQETSPMGTRVCRASMQYTLPTSLTTMLGASAGLTWVPLSGRSDNCRWK